jgi:hypothetical protein
MTLRMHPVSASRWEQLAATRHPIDLTEEPAPRAASARADKGRRRRSEHAAIQAQVDALALQPVPANR